MSQTASPAWFITPLATERLALRALDASDAPFILELLNEPAFIDNIADKGVRDLDGARAYIANGPQASYARHGLGLLRVALRGTDEPVGICGLLKRDELPEPDLGFAILARHHRKGYATEAGAEVLRHGFHVLGFSRIVAITSPANEPSARVLKRLGMREEGRVTLPEYGEDRLFALER